MTQSKKIVENYIYNYESLTIEQFIAEVRKAAEGLEDPCIGIAGSDYDYEIYVEGKRDKTPQEIEAEKAVVAQNKNWQYQQYLVLKKLFEPATPKEAKPL